MRSTNISPGFSSGSEFWNVRLRGNDEAAAKVHAGTVPLTTADIAEAAYWVATLPAHGQHQLPGNDADLSRLWRIEHQTQSGGLVNSDGLSSLSHERRSASVRVEALEPAFAQAAAVWAERLHLRSEGEAEFALQVGRAGLQFVELSPHGGADPGGFSCGSGGAPPAICGGSG